MHDFGVSVGEKGEAEEHCRWGRRIKILRSDVNCPPNRVIGGLSMEAAQSPSNAKFGGHIVFKVNLTDDRETESP